MKPTVTIISVGPGDPELMNQKTLNLLKDIHPVILRTSRHPFSGWLEKQNIPFFSADSLYESSDDFDTLAASVSDFVWEKAAQYHDVVYAVPDSVTDRTVDALFRKKPQNGVITAVPGFSYADYYLSSCRGEIDAPGIQISSATDFLDSDYDPSLSLLITEIDNEILAGDVKDRLSGWLDDEEKIIFMDTVRSPRLISLFELDRQKNFSHLTALAVNGRNYAERKKKTFSDLLEIMDLLRSPEGCSWDRAQTHKSLTPYLIEEAWETADAIDEDDPDHLAEELGDLLFQIAFHTSIGKSMDEMTIQEITTGICDKMIRRHPHVFDKESYKPDGSQEDKWEKIKQQENHITSFTDSLRHISTGLPALRYTEKLIRKLSAVPGLSRKYDEIADSIEAAAGSLKKTGIPENGNSSCESILGDLLFLCAELACHTGTDAEVLLHRTAMNVIKRIQQLESDGKKPSDVPERLTFNDLGVY